MPLLLSLALTFRLTDSAGVAHTEAELALARASVFVFLSDGCPLSSSYRPVLERLFNQYSVRQVLFYAVNSRGAHSFPDLLDTRHEIARQLGVSVTPQAVVVSASGQVLYSGRIDDRTLTLGKTRVAASREDLREALDDVLAGRPVTVSRTKPAGCAIEFPRPVRAGGPTFARHVAPILFRHCTECHRDAGSGPFPLLTYRDAASRATTIAAVTAARRMPPWLPEPNSEHPFEGARRLASTEIDTLRKWADTGASEGDPTAQRAPPNFSSNWGLETPDLVVSIPAFNVPPDGPDLYQCLVIPLGLSGVRYVRAFEFRPGARNVTHHALTFLDSTGAARRRDAESEGPGYPCFGLPGFLPAASLGGWAPGTGVVPYPAGGAVTLRPGMDLVVQVHYHPNGQAVRDQSSLAVAFQADPPSRRMMDIALGTRRIDIIPGDPAYLVRDHFEIPVDVDATGIIPHAHYIARRMRGWAILPDKRRVELIHIPEWDFNWQQQYRYRKPIRLPAGTEVRMEFQYDNSEGNARNPFRPPRRIQWGPESTDEMAGLHLQVMPVRNEDAEELGRALWGKMMRELGSR
jgi:hypothetical protein